MNKQNLIRAAGMLLLVLVFNLTYAFSGGSIMGQVLDPDTKEPVAFATVVLHSASGDLAYVTDEKGYYYASNIPTGVYTVVVAVMSNKSEVTNVKVTADATLTVNVDVKSTVDIGGKDGFVKTEYRPPLIDRIDSKMGILETKEIKNTSNIVKVSDVAANQPATVKVGNDYYVRGARAGGLAYYIDGGKVMGTPDIPLCGLDTYRMYSGHVPAKYGDALGGIVVIEIRNFFSEQQ
jgi:hypothetical protein